METLNHAQLLFLSISLIVTGIIIMLVQRQMKKDTENINESLNVRQILFNLENNTDNDVWVDLMRLNPNDGNYSFYTSDGNYPMLVEYLKVFSFNVIRTSVNYQHDNWQSDILYNYSYSPFGISQKPVFIGFHNFNRNQEHRNFISNNYEYSFDFFNTVVVKLTPNEKKAITMDVSEVASGEENIYPKCALLVKNNTDETKKIKLFDKEFYEQFKDSNYIESVFGQVSYEEVLKHFDSEDLTATKIKMFIGNDNHNSSCTINFDEFKLIDKVDVNQEQNEVVEIDLGGEVFIALFEVEVKPNTKMYISLV